MIEQEKVSPETSEQVGNRLLEFIRKTEFGSPEYQAVSDYVHLKNLEDNLATELRNAGEDEKDSEGKARWESQARITEQEIAIHKTQIYNYQTRLKGYDRAYTYVGIGFEHDLYDATRRELTTMSDQDPLIRDFYAGDIHSKYFSKAESIIDEKSSNSFPA